MSSWDQYYQNDLDNNGYDSEDDAKNNEEGQDLNEDETADPPPDPSELESWFDDVGAPAKTLAFLTDASFPLSPQYLSTLDDDDDSQKTTTTTTTAQNHPTVLDLGTGNGSALFSLRLEGEYRGRMVGVDYSRQSIELARRLWRQYADSSSSSSCVSSPKVAGPISFEELDLIHDDPTSSQLPWWPTTEGGFDLVLDKGTFDAISLSSSTIHDPVSNLDRRVCELYPAKVARMVRPGGFLLVTSCNWTEEEVVRWFTGSESESDAEPGGERARGLRLEVYNRIRYPIFEFGGQKGQGVASVCFRRVDGLR